ncbi:MAG: conjugal transfer protein TraF [Marinobacter sp.]|nr:conjugal transfer protein TraF [Marinobacter sp.]
MHPYRLSRLFIAISLSVAATSALASPQAFMSSRSFAMGGTGVAVAHPSNATSANPAMMAADHHSWSDDFGLTLPSVNARVADEEEVIDQVDDIQDVIDGLESSISGFNPSTDSPQSIQNNAAALRDRLATFDDDTMRANIGLGLSLAVPGKALAVGLFSNANLTATVRGNVSDSDKSKLNAIVTATSATDVESKANAIKNSDGSLALTSEGKILASAVIEAGISFAHALELNNGDTVELGFSPKYVQLQTFQYTETVSGFEDDEFDGDEYQTEKSGFNLDIGAAYAFGDEKQWNAGIVVKNIIPMELDSAQSKAGEEKRTLELNPMATVGIAHKSNYHVVTAEVDLTKKEAFGFEDDTQWVALGAEFDAWRYAQLRVGARYNLASNDDNDGIAEETQFTAGIGLNVFGARLDLGALISDADMGAALELGAAF